MKISQIFLSRYTVLYDFWLEGVWETVPAALMRQRPHPKVNSIAWNLWHIARGEDAGLNRFVVDRAQVLDDGGWMQSMDAPWRHHGSGMSFAEVDELSQRIDLNALHGYSRAVQTRTLEIVAQIDTMDLSAALSEEFVRQVIIDEGLAHSDPEGFIQNYTGWTKARSLFNLGLTHPYQHLGEIGVIASLLGIDFD
jgi:hypothetical protein